MHPNSMADFEEARTIKQSNGATYHRPLKKVKVEHLQNDDDAFSDEEIFTEDDLNLGNLLPLTSSLHSSLNSSSHMNTSANQGHSMTLPSMMAATPSAGVHRGNSATLSTSKSNKTAAQEAVEDKFLDFIMDTNLPIDIGENKSMNKMVQC